MEDVFIVQAWHHNHCRDCNAAVYLEWLSILWFNSMILLRYPSQQTHYCSTSIQLQFFNNCSKYQYLRYKSHGSVCKTERKFSKNLWKADFRSTFCHVRSFWTGMEHDCPVRNICVQECWAFESPWGAQPAVSAHSPLSYQQSTQLLRVPQYPTTNAQQHSEAGTFPEVWCHLRG